MMVSTKGRYALRIMVDLAENGKDSPVSLKDIAQRESIGIKYLEIIVSSLNKNGLLESVRGKNGGYMLKKPANEYSISSILNAAEGSLAPVACVETEDSCENAHCCKTYRLWKELDDVIENYLSSKTLADII